MLLLLFPAVISSLPLFKVPVSYLISRLNRFLSFSILSVLGFLLKVGEVDYCLRGIKFSLRSPSILIPMSSLDSECSPPTALESRSVFFLLSCCKSAAILNLIPKVNKQIVNKEEYIKNPMAQR